MRGLHLCLKALGVGHIRDTQCGFKVLPVCPCVRLMLVAEILA
jgi:hypothetical protein